MWMPHEDVLLPLFPSSCDGLLNIVRKLQPPAAKAMKYPGE
eukprot:CAMPEP_0172776092 /NCGR_PEP_ID=MMETSP1074-20121228/199213_1 /TAXON_ID=2916 /ORGANISM="Ceratium fusus, Strain PA161109" /LENGTH=40 /DNA_ID= /DNA_START= /DNA_END= /DNA_ORIENTATION=